MSLIGRVSSWLRPRKDSAQSDSVIKGWMDLGYKPNWFQLGGQPATNKTAIQSSAVYACVSILSQEIARLNLVHYTNPDLTGSVEMYKSHSTRLMHKPNSYQTLSDFLLQIMYSLLMDGNSYCLATRDVRGRVIDLTPLNPLAVQPYVTPESNEVYYSISQMDIEPGDKINTDTFIPARNMLHTRLFTPTHPLMGVSPLIACLTSVNHGLSIQEQSTTFFDNGAKPSGILRTPKPLGKDQAKRLRDAWSQGNKGVNAGKVPVLDNDLQFQQMSLSAADSQLIEQYGMTKKDVSIVYRVPLYMVGEGDAQFKTAEASQRDFVTRSLGFYVQHLEASFNNFFGFDGRTEYWNFDVEAGIMRPEYVARIEGLAKGVQGGIYAPNEARASESLKAKEGGDDLYMQRQMVPLDLLGLDVMAMTATGESNTEDEPDTDDESETDDDADTDDEAKMAEMKIKLENALTKKREAHYGI